MIKKRKLAALLASIFVLTLFAGCESEQPASSNSAEPATTTTVPEVIESENPGTENMVKTDTAQLCNFISGLWEAAGDNGMPTPEAAKISRPINIGLDTDGNAIQAIDEQDLRYFDGKYYLYGQSFSYGTFHYAPGTRQWANTPTTPESFYRYGGTAVYSSDDLMNWKYETTIFIEDEDGIIITVKKPRIVYSEATGKYVFWFCGEPPYGISGVPAASQIFKIAVSDSPTGPFKVVGRPQVKSDPTGNAIGADYEICLADDGTAYLVNSHNGYSISRLSPEMDSIEETVVIAVASGTMGGGVGLHHHNGWWYITSSGGCGNCVSSPFWYIMAKDPMGPWMSPADMSTEQPLQPAKLLDNVESAQIHGAKSFPDSNGNMNTLIPATHYRRDLGAPEASGDNNFAHTGHYYIPLSYDSEGHILPPELKDVEEFPLASEVTATIPAAYEAQLNITATDIFEHTDPAETSKNIRYVEQSWELKDGETLAAIMPAVFQRTPDYSDQGTAKPTNHVPAQDTNVNAPLEAELKLPDGTVYDWTIEPGTVRWAPSQVALNLPKAYTGAGQVTLSLKTQGTNGGYGVAVGFKSENNRYALNNSSYRTYNEKDGGWVERPDAEMLICTSSTPLTAPEITVQPHNVSSMENGLASFWVEAKGIGLGYRWMKDGEVIYSEFSSQSGLGTDASAPCFRLQDLTKDDAGVYTVEVFNQVGSVVSEPMTLTVEDAYAVSGNVKIDGWKFFNGEKEAIAKYNTVVKMFKVDGNTVSDQPCAETLVRGDGRYCFEVGYTGDVTNVDDIVARKFVPGKYKIEVVVRSDGKDYSASQMIEITNSALTVDLSIENVPIVEPASTPVPGSYELPGGKCTNGC